jgi:hypothetical protein
MWAVHATPADKSEVSRVWWEKLKESENLEHLSPEKATHLK